MMGIAAQSITEILGDKGLLGLQRSVGAEDFHMFAQAKPELKTTYIGLGCDLEPGLHHPDMHFAKEALLDGVNILVNMAYKILG
jgi:amidohydrolase